MENSKGQKKPKGKKYERAKVVVMERLKEAGEQEWKD